MGASPARRQKRQGERTAKKLYAKISKQTLDQINRQSPEEREQLLMLYNKMLQEKNSPKND
jgi:hypothetical protein